MKKNSLIQLGVIGFITASAVLAAHNQKIVEAASGTTPVTHIGTYDGSTTFTTSSANGVNPGLFIEVMDKDGNLVQYESEDGVITVENTKQGAYVTQAKLLGKTMYRDLDTGELLETWEEGRNLELESSKMPVLKTTGKNLMPINSIVPKRWSGNILNHKICDINLKPNTSYTFSNGFDGASNAIRTRIYDDNNTLLVEVWGNEYRTFKTNTNENYWVLAYDFGDGNIIKDIQIEEGAVKTAYEPYKSNILSCNEEVTLRGIDNVQDTLDLMTGELTEHIKTTTLDRFTKWNTHPNVSEGFSHFTVNVTDISTTPHALLCDSLPAGNIIDVYNGTSEGLYHSGNKYLHITIKTDKLSENSINGLNQYLNDNIVTIQYPLATPTIKTVGLTADGYFAPETSAQVSIKGETVPLIASITVPTETLSFVIDPNQEVDQQFIAPEFTVTNDTYAPLKLEIKSFTQLTNGMYDVLPSKHSDWTTLGKQESNDIALAVVPKPGAGWKSLTEGERYVADNSNYELGVINPAETVEFSFSALHGPTITKPINLQYTLGLIFDFE